MWYLPILFFGGSFLAGVMNSVAGGGSIVIYPLLVALGIPPIHANASTSVAVLPGNFSSAYAYRQHIRKLPWRYYLALIPCIVGGYIGADILRHTTNHAFERIVPWFLLLGVSLIVVQPTVMAWAKKKRGHHRRNKMHTFIFLMLTMTAVSIYGGFFGAGFAIVALALLGFTELTDIHAMNGLKNLTAAAVNLTSSLYLMSHGLVQWEILPWLLVGNVVGGWFGANYATHLKKSVVRWLIIVIGLTVTIALFLRK